MKQELILKITEAEIKKNGLPSSPHMDYISKKIVKLASKINVEYKCQQKKLK